MNLDEVIETQAAIIEMQSGLIRKLAAALNIDLAYNDEVARVRKLEEKLKEGDHGL